MNHILNKPSLKLSFNLIVLITLSSFILSCNGRSAENQNSNFSESGIKLSSKIIDVYNNLDSIANNQDYQKELLKIVNDISPDTYIMKIGKKSDVNEVENQFELNAFRSLANVYTSYNLQLDPAISESSANLREKIILACNALDSLNLSETLKLKKDRIRQNVSLSKYKTDEAIFQLTDLYAEFWNDESQKWILFLESNHESIKKGIESIPISSISAEKVIGLTKEPYSSVSVLVNLYKLNLIKENQKVTRDLGNDINLVSKCFNLMIQCQGELMKRNRDKMKIDELNGTLELLLIDK
jgi:hypothetical protein